MTETIERKEEQSSEPRSVAGWLRVSRYAGFGVGVWAVALQLLAGQVIPPVTVYGIVFVGLALFLRGERRRLSLIFGIVALAALLANLPGTIDELSNPSSAPAFILTLMVTLSALTAVVAALAAMFRWSAEPIRALAITGAAVFLLGVLVAVVAAAGIESDVALTSDTEVILQGVQFQNDEITVSAGDVGVWVDNRDGIRHSFSITELGVDLDVPGLKAQRTTFEAAAGEYTIFCNVPGHENMMATLVVEE